MISEAEKVLVTGAAGFIGAALSYKLLQDGFDVMGIDNLNNYYDPKLKESRIKLVENFAKKFSLKWSFKKIGIENNDEIT